MGSRARLTCELVRILYGFCVDNITCAVNFCIDNITCAVNFCIDNITCAVNFCIDNITCAVNFCPFFNPAALIKFSSSPASWGATRSKRLWLYIVLDVHSPYLEIVLESEGFPLSSKELLCLESTREARFGSVSVIPLFCVQLSKEKGTPKSRKTCVRIYIAVTLPHRNRSSKYCTCADLITKS